MSKKPVLVLEKANALLERKSATTPGHIILEGIFADFGVKNRNGRIYQAEKYLPHLDYLNEKITNGNLLGELDHPDQFETRLSNVSHVVESIWYDEGNGRIMGRIRLLNTTPGQQAQKLIQDGISLSISSRAAGVVNEDSTVDIKRIFSYDLVAEPGFSSAKLDKINESLGIDDENIAIFEANDKMIKDVKDTKFVNEMLELCQGDDCGCDLPINENQYIEKEAKTENGKQMSNYVTKKELQEYSKFIKENFDSLKDSVETLGSAINESSDSELKEKFENVSTLKKKVDKMIGYSNYLAENHNINDENLSKIERYTSYLAENMNRMLDYVEYVVRRVDKEFDGIEGRVNENASKIDKGIQYSNYLAENLNRSINHTDHVAQMVNENINYSNYLAEMLEHSIGHQDYIAGKVEENINYSEYIAEHLNDSIGHQDYIAEMLNKSISHQDYLAENLDAAIGYSEYVAKNALNPLPDSKGGSLNEGQKYDGDKNLSLNEQIERFSQTVDKRKAAQGKGAAFGNISESARKAFQELPSTDKEKVLRHLKENDDVKGEQDFMKLVESYRTPDPQKEKIQALLEHMPEPIAKVWDSVSENEKKTIFSRAKYWDLSDKIKIKDFWLRQNLMNEASQAQDIDDIRNRKADTSDFYKNVNEGKSAPDGRPLSLGYDRNSIEFRKQSLMSRAKK